MKSVLFAILTFTSFWGFSQQDGSPDEPIIPVDKAGLLKNIDITLDLRMDFQAYTYRGGDNYYNGLQFENGFTALGIAAKINDNLKFKFRNRFNKSGDIQSLDRLGSNIELAYIDVKLSNALNMYLGKMTALYGGYEYEFIARDVLEYNDIYGNALAFVTGAGLSYKTAEHNTFGLQILNSRTALYEDIYGDVVAENIQEPDWPVTFVGNWRGSFFDGKLETIYSLSHSTEVKDRGTTFFTLGHKYENKKITLMYDFHYSYEEIDTKGIVTRVIDNEVAAENVTYIENWFRGKYRFSPKIEGLLTLMTSSARDNAQADNKLIRTSYGVIPTVYYSPFKDLNVKFYFAYIGRYYDYSEYAIDSFGASSFNKNEVRVGFIAPLLLL